MNRLIRKALAAIILIPLLPFIFIATSLDGLSELGKKIERGK